MNRDDQPPPATGESAPGLRGLRVLVVEGNEEGRRSLGRLLRSLGVAPTLMAEAGPAIEELRLAAGAGQPYALLLFDSTLRGSAVFRARRASDNSLLAVTPRIELAAEPRRADDPAERGPRLQRPVTPGSLSAALGQALGGASALPQARVAPSAPVSAKRPQTLPYDRRLLVNLLGDDEAAAQRVLERFVEQASLRLRELDEAVSSGNGLAIAERAHRLRGALSWISAAHAASVAAEIEGLCRAGQTAGIAELCATLRRETEGVVAEIQGDAGPPAG